MKLEVSYAIDLISAANASGSMRAKFARVKRHREAALLWLTSAQRRTGLVPQLPCVITLTRYGIKRLDGDNLQHAFKPTRDGIACVGSKTRPAGFLRVDDADARLTWRYQQFVVKRAEVGPIVGQSRVRIEIEWNEEGEKP